VLKDNNVYAREDDAELLMNRYDRGKCGRVTLVDFMKEFDKL